MKRVQTLNWCRASSFLVMKEPPVPVLNNKLELFSSSLPFPHLNGIKKPVLGPVQKKNSNYNRFQTQFQARHYWKLHSPEGCT
jgi:hypothetical protein